MAQTGIADTIDATDEPQTGPLAETSMVKLGAAVSRPISDLLVKDGRPDFQAICLDEKTPFDHATIYAEVFVTRDEVHEHVVKCNKKLKLPVADASPKPDWKEVDTTVKDACDDIQRLASGSEAATGAAGNLRRAFRSLCKHAGAGETFVSVIPTDQFGFASVLCGGLKAVFSALKHTHEYREKVYLALEDLPYIICDHSVPLDDHIHDEELHRRAAGLHIAVFKVIKRILRWWLSGSFGESVFQTSHPRLEFGSIWDYWCIFLVTVIANPSKLLSDLNEDLAEVKVKASRFELRALKITQRLQRQSFQLQYLSALDSERNTLEVQNLRRDVRSLKEIICRASSLGSLGSATHRIVDRSLNESLQPSVKSDTSYRRQLKLNVETLLDKFCYERDLVPDDCQTLMKLMNPHRSSVTDYDRIISIESSFRIQAWLIIDEPSLLLIDGRAESRRDIEVSIFVARIVHRLHSWQAEFTDTDEDAPIIVSLAFFCSQHRGRQDVHSNPTELAMSLLLQLMDQCREDFSSSLLQKVAQELDPTNMSSICSKLEELIMSLGGNVVLILLIEGLIHFTQDEVQTSQTQELISFLVAIYRRRPTATLKLLFSSPTRPDFVEDLFQDKELLRLPRSVASAHSPNNMHWKKPVEFRSRTDRDGKYR
ncbi:hypothetical protein G7054_g6316 [Neopestalotiopsis clavispora]|nr:hypothetical protein G7054_g6316 [Neopestalotiopsis clavispora]